MAVDPRIDFRMTVPLLVLVLVIASLHLVGLEPEEMMTKTGARLT